MDKIGGIGWNLKMIRARSGLTIAELANLVDVSAQTWIRWEKMTETAQGTAILVAAEKLAELFPDTSQHARNILAIAQGDHDQPDASSDMAAVMELIGRLIRRYGTRGVRDLLTSLNGMAAAEPKKPTRLIVHHGPTNIGGVEVSEMRSPYDVTQDGVKPAAIAPPDAAKESQAQKPVRRKSS